VRAPNMNSIAIRLMDAAFVGIVKVWPADSRAWARAMYAEYYELTAAGEKLSWLLGGTMSLTSAWTQRLMGGSRKTGETVIPKPVKRPGALAFALMALAVASLALPGMRQGIVTIAQTWNGAHAVLTQSDLEEMGRVAEQRKDAKMLAFVATRIWDPSKSAHYADAAIALDQNLTWIYFETNGLGAMIHPSTEELQRRAGLLQKWDPDNATPWLMEANIAFSQIRVVSGNPQWGISSRSWNAAAKQLAKNPAWAGAMEKAFAAKRYDDYVRRNYDLILTVMREHGMDRPVALSLNALSIHVPNLLIIQVYSAGLIEDGELCLRDGDLTGASAKFWAVARQGQLISTSSARDSFAYSTALAMKQRAFDSLRSLAENAGHTNEIAYATYEVASLERERAEILDGYRREWPMARSMTFASQVVHVSAEGIVVGALLTSISVFGYAFGLGSRPRLGKWICRFVRLAPVALILSLTLFYVSYYPYLNSFRTATPDNIRRVVLNFGGILYSPLLPIPYGHTSLYFWTAILTVCCSALLFLTARMAIRARLEKRIA
jgi:hypothetical protein